MDINMDINQMETQLKPESSWVKDNSIKKIKSSEINLKIKEFIDTKNKRVFKF